MRMRIGVWAVILMGLLAVPASAQTAVQIPDGRDATQGAKADAKSTATDNTPATLMQVFKEISFMAQNPAGVGATGAAVPAAAVYTGAGNAAGNLVGDIVCQNSKIYDTNTNGNTELVPISGSTHVYVCGYEMLAAGTVNLSLVAGTGTACASAASGTPSTGTSGASAPLTPAWQFTTQTGKLSMWPTHGWLIDAGSANALCLKASVGVAAQVQIFYAQR